MICDLCARWFSYGSSDFWDLWIILSVIAYRTSRYTKGPVIMITDQSQISDQSSQSVISSHINGFLDLWLRVISHYLFAVPSSSPRDLTVTSSTINSLAISWTLLTQDEANGPVTGYYVRYKIPGVKSSTKFSRLSVRIQFSIFNFRNIGWEA